MAIAATLFVVLVVWIFFFPLLCVYEVDEEGVSVRVLAKFVPLRVRHRDIQRLERMSWWHALRLNFQSLTGRRQWNVGNRLFGERVVIHRNDGVLVVLTPADVDRFVREVERKRLPSGRG